MNKFLLRFLCCTAAVMVATNNGSQQHAAATPPSVVSAPTANGWVITPIAQDADIGFQLLIAGAVNTYGRVAVHALHSRLGNGVFAIDAGQVISVALENSALPGGLGTVLVIDQGRDSLAVDETGAVWFVAATSVLPQVQCVSLDARRSVINAGGRYASNSPAEYLATQWQLDC